MPLQNNYHVYPSPVEPPCSLPFDTPADVPYSVHDYPSAAVVVSPHGIISVLGYTPTEGEGGAPISVRIHFRPEYTDAIFVRLVVGHKAVATTVHEIPDVPCQWQLDAVAPPFDQNAFPSHKVLISVQALDKDNAILDTVTFGEFCYWAPGLLSPLPIHPRSPCELVVPSTPPTPRDIPPHAAKRPKLQINTTPKVASNHAFRRRGVSHLPTPSPTSPDRRRASISSISSQHIQLHRRTKSESMTRPKNGKNGESHVQTPILDLVTPLKSICSAWTPAEVTAGRRLVRFSKVHDGRRLIVSCEPIKCEDYRESDSVISCIYREESDSCYVTSVDIIFLLERLTSSDFPVEEKNRIRRNLEGLRPTTVSKHKHGFEDFFQRIMEFPDPKPRNIEKDLKVFEWSLLDQALDKILSKYTIDTPPVQTEEPESPGEPSSSSSSDSVEYQLGYPPVKVEEPSYSTDDAPPPPPSSQYESSQDDFHFLNSSDGSESLSSPLDAPSSAISYQVYTADVVQPEAGGGSSTSSWGSDYKPVDTMTLDHFTSYEVAHHTGPITYPEIDFNPYGALTYHGSIPGDTMGMAENPYI
ncbi:hypothetical protein Hypma_008094 [Hypsizygus marmoreus]|uniref:DUF7082 domain-containing protein n=1 Tax=Hypsizygus marmoreus TaxID=39966 RepID=A0A369JSW0_HYPMA|nr:hypothetical protein Hypma_008094 [Hypsizygus marmoreus]